MSEGKFCYKYPRPSVTTDCVVFGINKGDTIEKNNLKVLLIKRGREPYKDKWAFPGGFLNEEESAVEGALRELTEETGLENIELIQLHTFSSPQRDPRGRVITIAYMGLTELEEVAGGDDASEAKWFPVDALPELAFDHEDIFKTAMDKIEDYIKQFKPVGDSGYKEGKEDLASIWNAMLRGEEYDATHSGLRDLLQKTRMKLWRLNNLSPDQKEERDSILKELFASIGERFIINQPFRCDYGTNIYLGDDCFINFNCTILDEAKVKIGNNAFIGPNVSIFTACHPLDADKRNQFIEWAEPVTIGDNVWIGGDATILPGVTIGDNVVIGAGAVVTKSFPSDVVIGGNPARIIKRLK